MDTQSMMLFAIIALVLIGVPVIIGRFTGQSPMEILFGSRVNRTFFGNREKREEKSRTGRSSGGNAPGNAPGGPAGGGSASGVQAADGNAPGDQAADGSSQGEAAKSLPPGAQKNSSREDLMRSISALLTYGRRNRFFTIVPGTLMHGDDVASLAVLIVTRNSVLGFNCFGYGGTVHVGSGEETWKQVLNGETIRFDSPLVKNKKQKEILDAVLNECGYPGTRTEIFGLFTSPDVVLKNNVRRNTRCCTQKAMMEVLNENRYLENGGINPRELGLLLEKHIKKA